MKIIFFCSSLEPGKDGVGDYTKLLAAELQKNFNCTVAIIALNDNKITNSIQGVQTVANADINVLRLPAVKSIAYRIQIAKAYIEQNNPDWISLQYVPYGFNNKGLAFQWPSILKQLTGGRKVNIMFHELWIGISVISPLKHKIIGYFQRMIAKKLIKALQPKIVFTSNLLYKMVLHKIYNQVDLLPLFGNIPIAPENNQFKNSILTQLGITNAKLNSTYLIGLFGTLYPDSGLESMLKDLLNREDVKNKDLYLIGFGNISNEGLHEFKNIADQFIDKITFQHFGALNESEVSNLFQIVNIGISTTPYQHIGKSGVFANMKLHGLEVLVPKGDFVPEYDSYIQEYNRVLMKKEKQEWSVEHIAQCYYNTLINKA